MARELMLVTRAALIPFPAGCQVAQIRSPTPFLFAHVAVRTKSTKVSVGFKRSLFEGRFIAFSKYKPASAVLA